MCSSPPLVFHIPRELDQGVSVNIRRISIFTDETEFLPYILAGKKGEKSLFTVFLLFHTDSNEKSIFLNSQPATASLPLRRPLSDLSQKFRAKVSNVHYLQMKCPNSVFPAIPSAGNPSEVLSRAGTQNLNKLIKSWGERETEQLSGLLAVHGWSVPFQERM